MEAQVIREIAHVANRRLDLYLPSWMDNQDVEVIVLPKMPVTKEKRCKKRIPNLMANKGLFSMAEDFNDELPDSFWLGGQ